jgi:hypothetical protein
MNKKLIKLTEKDLHKIVKQSINNVLKETQMRLSPSHEARLRTEVVGELAQEIGSILRKLTMYDRGMNNYLADLVKNEKWVDDLWGVYYSMKEFAEATPQVNSTPI